MLTWVGLHSRGRGRFRGASGGAGDVSGAAAGFCGADVCGTVPAGVLIFALRKSLTISV